MFGENRFPPVGLMTFSVGDGGAALEGVVVVVVVVVVVDGACSPLLPHPARSAPIATSAPPPTTAARRGMNGFELMVRFLSSTSIPARIGREFSSGLHNPR